MPIGVGAAMLIGSAVAGGSALAAAGIQSHAASEAQKKQQAATDKALAVQQQAMSPYQQIGQVGLQRLAAQQPAPYTQQFRAGSGNTGFQPYQPATPPLAPPQGPPPTLGGIGQPPPQGGMVTLRAPDGSTRQFPAVMAAQIMQQAAAAGHQLQRV